MSYQNVTKIAFALCALAAIFYNSWPLGYLLNNQVAHYYMASELARTGQPYHLLFILGDVLTGMCMIVVAALIRLKLWSRLHSKTWATVYLGLLVFSVFTALAAIMPSQHSLDEILSRFVYNGQGLGLDGLLSAIAALGLLASVISVSLFNARQRLDWVVTLMVPVVMVVWAASGIVFVILATDGGNAHPVQQIFIVLYGVALIAIGLSVNLRYIDNDARGNL